MLRRSLPVSPSCWGCNVADPRTFLSGPDERGLYSLIHSGMPVCAPTTMARCNEVAKRTRLSDAPLPIYWDGKWTSQSLYLEVVAAGIPVHNHESDLYIPDTEAARAILARYPTKAANAKRFENQVEGGTWIDVPFAFDPFWTAKAAR